MANARYFDGTDDELITSAGSVDTTGAYSFAVLFRGDSSAPAATRYLLHIFSSVPGFRRGFRVDSTGVLATGNLVTYVTGSTTINEDEWIIVGVSKAAGTATPRFHIYQGGSWTHENASGTQTDPAGTDATVQFGTYGGVAWTQEDMAAAAVWNSELSDSEMESYTGWDRPAGWRYPDALWSFQQASVSEDVVDLTGGGADQSDRTGTTVITDGPESYFYQTGEVVGTIVSTDGLTVDALMVPDES
jgi:hypothetical protein